MSTNPERVAKFVADLKFSALTTSPTPSVLTLSLATSYPGFHHGLELANAFGVNKLGFGHTFHRLAAPLPAFGGSKTRTNSI